MGKYLQFVNIVKTSYNGHAIQEKYQGYWSQHTLNPPLFTAGIWAMTRFGLADLLLVWPSVQIFGLVQRGDSRGCATTVFFHPSYIKAYSKYGWYLLKTMVWCVIDSMMAGTVEDNPCRWKRIGSCYLHARQALNLWLAFAFTIFPLPVQSFLDHPWAIHFVFIW